MKKLVASLLGAAAMFGATAVSAATIGEVESNDTIATSQNIDAYFSLDYDADIGDMAGNTSTTIAHATVLGQPGNGTFDVYSFTVGTAGSRGIFDIDYAINFDGHDFDAFLSIFDSAGNSLAANDDNNTTFGAGGSVHGYDSYVEYTFATAGTYFVEVGNCCRGPQFSGNGYELQVSIGNHALTNAVPEPATWAFMIVGFGAVGASMRRIRNGNKSLATA